MTIVDTTPPSRRRRSSRRRKPAQPRRRQRLLITRRRSSSPLRVPYADGALNFLMQEADIFKVGRRRYLVAPLSAELVDVLIQAAGAGEDAEADGDDEPMLSWGVDGATADQRQLSTSPADEEPSFAAVEPGRVRHANDRAAGGHREFRGVERRPFRR